MDLAALTIVHTALSLVALVVGLVVMFGLFRARTMPVLTFLYLFTSIATSVTGFFFPFDRFLPSHWFGVISLVLLALAILGRYVFDLAAAWRWSYALSIVITVYLLAFVTIVQSFLKIPALRALAPTTTETPFAVAQLVALVLFIAAGIAAIRGLRSRPSIGVAYP